MLDEDLRPLIFRKRPVTVEAMRFRGEASWNAIKNWVHENGGATCKFISQDYPSVWNVLEKQWIQVPFGHWVIRGVQGEFYPCDHWVLMQTYELVSGMALGEVA